jgi:ABC-type phosphonate transport system ATPase subunit
VYSVSVESEFGGRRSAWRMGEGGSHGERERERCSAGERAGENARGGGMRGEGALMEEALHPLSGVESKRVQRIDNVPAYIMYKRTCTTIVYTRCVHCMRR